MWAAILITTIDVFFFMLLETTGIRALEAMFAAFIAVMAGTFLYMVRNYTYSPHLS
jgi:Mn2+/Fe2+ NRAMP family transporter